MSEQEEKDKLSVSAEDNSIAVGSIAAGGNIGDINISTGYTADQVSILITQIQSTFQPKPFDGRCPYKGLDVFEEEDAELFFGREKLVDDLVSRMKDSRTVFVTGPSGSGKSSLVRAGLIHALKQGAIKNSERWLYATMKPGRDPIGELGRVVSNLAGTTNAEDEIRSKSPQDASIFGRWCEIVLKEGREKRFVLFIDQFEEVFTQIGKEEDRMAFLKLLTHSAEAENGRLSILFAMRSDFVPNCATYSQLNSLLNKQFVQIGAMQPEELVSAIAQPALRVGLRIDPDLIAQVINDMKGEPGALPLMQFALKDLFDSMQAKGGVIQLTLNDYLQRGGIRKSLERHADAAFASLGAHEKELARSIFSGLIEIGRGTQDTKRTALFDELIPASAKAEEVEIIVRKLADARLITTDEAAGRDTVTISHEKLIDAWPWLKKLVNENRDVIALQNEIAGDAKEWEEHKRDASYLYTGGRLANVREQIEKQKFALGHLAQDFVRAGRARQRRAQIFLVSAVSTVLIAAIVASVVFQKQAQANIEIANAAQAASTFAVAQQVAAQANAEEAKRQSTIALARQLVTQAQSIDDAGDSAQIIAAQLYIQSMKLFPTNDAAGFLINDNYYAVTVSSVTQEGLASSVAFSPDSQYVISGSDDGTARVWEAASGEVIASMTHEGPVQSVAFNFNGKYVVSGSDDGTARVWEAVTGKEIARMTHDDSVYAAAFSPDGEYVISGSQDGTARVWEAATGKEIARMTHDDSVYAVAFSPDGGYVVSGGCDVLNDIEACIKGTARVWKTATGEEIARMTHNGKVTSVAFNMDTIPEASGKYVVSGGTDSTVRVWEADTGEEVALMKHEFPVTSVAFNPKGSYAVVSGSYDGTARVWETFTGKEIAHMTHGNFVRSVVFSPDGKYVVSAGDDGTASMWESDTGKEIARMTHDDLVNSLAISPDGRYIVSGGCDTTDNNNACLKGTARVWKAATGEELARTTHDDSVRSAAFSPDGKYVVSGGCDLLDGSRACIKGTVRVWEAGSGKERVRMTHAGTVYSIAFSPNGEYVASGGADGTARMWEAFTGKEITRVTYDVPVYAVAFSPDSQYVVSAVCDEPVDGYLTCGKSSTRVWETTTGKEVTRKIYDSSVYAVAFSSDGKYIASGGSDGTIHIWEFTTGVEVASMTHADDPVGEAYDVSVRSVAFSPDDRYVVSGSWDGTARIWEFTTGMEVARLSHGDLVEVAAFSPDGKFVVSGSTDGTARVWEVATGKEIAHMIHGEGVTTAGFSPNGRVVVSGSHDGTARVWLWQPQDLIANACNTMPRNLIYAEWIKYIGDGLPYRTICPNLPLDSESLHTLARDILSNTKDPDRVKTAFEEVKAALMTDTTVQDPAAESTRVIGAVVSERIFALSMYQARGVDDALDLLEQTGEMNIPIEDHHALINLCWIGSLQGHEKQVLQYCDLAVNLEPGDWYFLDSRGLARALTGDFEGAILDFQHFVDESTKEGYGQNNDVRYRQLWIVDLKAGRSPFTPEILQALKTGMLPDLPIGAEFKPTAIPTSSP